MEKPKFPAIDSEREKALADLDILDTGPEEMFDEVVQFIQAEFDVPISLISLVDGTRQWFKAKAGLLATETDRNISFCGHAIQGEGLFEVNDALSDARFSDNPLVTNDPSIRFYAGTPLITEEGHALGTLCVIDTKPRTLTTTQRNLLELLGKQVIRLIQSRKHRQELNKEVLSNRLEKKMLEAISGIQSGFIKNGNEYALFSDFLSSLLQLTDSEYGFIGEVLTDKNGKNYLKNHATTDISWNDETSEWYQQNAPKGLEFTNLNTLFGHVITTGKPLITNNAPTHSAAGGIPSGHPPLNKFAGIPFQYSGKMLGMVGLANSLEGYSEQLITTLSPVLDTCTQLILVMREKAKNRSMQEQLQEFKSIVDKTTDCVFMFDPDTLRFTYTNQGAERQVGYTDAELLDMQPYDIMPEYDEKTFREMLKPLIRGELPVANFETIHQHKNGVQIDVNINLQLVTTLTGTQKFIAIVRDITDVKKNEASLRQSQKMEAIGRLAGGVAHDFNNQLAAIMGYAELIEAGEISQGLQRYATKIKDTADDARKMTSQLLIYSRQDNLCLEVISANALINDLAEMISLSLHHNIKVNIGLLDIDCNIIGDKASIKTALLNICLNAKDAMLKGGELGIKAQRASGDTQENAINNGADAHLCIEISDIGSGIAPDNLQNIFEPFFTTKNLGEGTGLGLASAKGAIEQNNGSIAVSSHLGIGTTFTICLPLAQGNEEETRLDDANDTQPSPGTKTILVVDDNEAVREVTVDFIHLLGHQSLAANDGFEAVKLYSQLGHTIDLMILDMIMPNMTGFQAYKEIRLINPGVKAIIASGYTADTETEEMLAEGIFAVLEKPYKLIELKALIDRI